MKSLLYHGFGIKGYRYRRTRYEKGEIIFELEPEGRPKVPQGPKPNQFHPCGCPSNYVSELLPTLASVTGAIVHGCDDSS